MNDEQQLKPPYLAYTTFKNFVASLNKNGVIPSRIDKSLMLGQSGATQSYLMSTLRFFGLIDANGAPTDDLQSLAKSDDGSRRSIWQKIYNPAYAAIVGDLDLERATLGMLNEKFSEQGYQGDTLRKSLSFFAAAAEDAGVALAPHLKPKARGSTRRPRRRSNGKPTEQILDDLDGGDDEVEPGRVSATLLLDASGDRKIELKAPATITKTELDRIQKWLSFQLIVGGEE